MARFLECWAASIVGVLIAIALLISPEAKSSLAGFNSSTEVLIGTSAMVGTILVLVLTLSVIPVQKAGENFTPAVSKICSTDALSRGVIVFLSVLLMLFNVLIFGELFGISKPWALLVQIIGEGLIIDLVRIYNRRVAFLITPSAVIEKMTNDILEEIDANAKFVRRVAFFEIALCRIKRIFNKYIEIKNKNEIETAIYFVKKSWVNKKRKIIDELLEIAKKAVNKGEAHIARMATESISAIAARYVRSRKDNLFIYHLDFMVAESDIHELLDVVYERLLQLSDYSLRNGDEDTACSVADAFRNIMIGILDVNSTVFGECVPVILWKPLFYMNAALKQAQNRVFLEVQLHISQCNIFVLQKVVLRKYSDVTDCSCIAIFENIEMIFIYFLEKNKGGMLTEQFQSLMLVISTTIGRCSFQIQLRALERFFPVVERMLPLIPLNDVYSVVRISASIYSSGRNSLCEILLNYHKKVLSAHVCGSGFFESEYTQIVEHFYHHLRRVAILKNCDVADTDIFGQIAACIDYIMGMIVPLSHTNSYLKDKFDTTICWIASFFWAAIKRTNSRNVINMKDACTILSSRSIEHLATGIETFSLESILSIFVIANKYCENCSPVNLTVLSDIIKDAFYISYFAEKKIGNKSRICEVYQEQLEKTYETIGNCSEEIAISLSILRGRLKKKEFLDDLYITGQFIHPEMVIKRYLQNV